MDKLTAQSRNGLLKCSVQIDPIILTFAQIRSVYFYLISSCNLFPRIYIHVNLKEIKGLSKTLQNEPDRQSTILFNSENTFRMESVISALRRWRNNPEIKNNELIQNSL